MIGYIACDVHHHCADRAKEHTEPAAPKQINQDDVTWDNVGDRLTEIFKTRAEKIMFVKGDDDITFDNVAQVIDIAHSSGVDKIGLITAKIESGQ